MNFTPSPRSNPVQPLSLSLDSSFYASAALEKAPLLSAPVTSRSSLLFIDSTVEDYQSLMAGVNAGTEVYLLDSTQDAIAQITNTLMGREGISSIHIVSHGEAGGIRLGSDWLNLKSLQTYASQLQSWGTALTEDADILLYGCNVAEGELGQAFVQIMSQLTGADIAASSNLTGSAALGGDWVLEVNTGNIEALLPFASSVLVNYGSILPVGPDGFGYIAASTQLQLIDLVPGAPGVFNTGLVGDDPPGLPIDLGSNTFRFYGQSYTGNNQLFVSANGLITFGSGNSAFSNTDFTSSPTQAAIAPAWDDWRADNGGSVLYQFRDLNGDGTNDELIIEWSTVPHFSNVSAGNATFQAILELNTGSANGNIIFNYPDLSIINTPIDEAGSATVAIKAADAQGNNRLLVALNTTASPYVGTGRAVLITNRVPIIDLDGDQSQATSGIGYATVFNEGGGAVSIVDSNNLLIIDPDSPNLTSATITLTNRPDGIAEVLAINTTGTNITASYDPGTGILSLTGSDTVENYQQVLRTITYNNTSANPNATTRIITFVVSDGSYTSPLASTTLGINAPTVDLNGDASGIDYFTFFPGGSAVAAVDRLNLTVSDPNDPTLSSATVTITNLRNIGSEILAANTDGTAIVASYTPSTGVLSLTGSDTVANYQQVLRSITYNNTAGNPDTRDRLISFVANDGTNNSPAAITTLRYGAPPAPVLDLNGPGAGINFSTTFTEGGGAVAIVNSSELTLTDEDSINLASATITLTNRPDGVAEVLAANTAGTNITASYDAATGVLSLSGSDTVGNYQQVLRTLTYNNTSPSPSTTARSITFVVNDGISNSAVATTTLSINASPAGISINDVRHSEGTRGNKTYTFTVSLSKASSETITVNYTTVDGTATIADNDYALANGTLTFAPGELSKTINVTVFGDSKLESTETFSVNLSNVSGNAILVKGFGTGIIADDDGNGPDFNLDGNVDFLWRTNQFSQTGIWLMNGTSIASVANLPAVDSNWEIEGMADFNDDGFTDILWRNKQTTQVGLWLMNGTTIASIVDYGQLGGWRVEKIADFSGDNQVDILWRNAGAGGNGIWVMNGTSFSSISVLPDANASWTIAAVGNFDGDSDLDILWQNTSTGQVGLWTMNNAAFVSSSLIATAPPNWTVVGAADFDGDNDLDLLWHNASTGQVGIWQMNGVSLQSVSLLPTVPGWKPVAITDLEGNGSLDIVLRNYQSGQNGVWRMNGTSFSSAVELPTVPLDWDVYFS